MCDSNSKAYPHNKKPPEYVPIAYYMHRTNAFISNSNEGDKIRRRTSSQSYSGNIQNRSKGNSRGGHTKALPFQAGILQIKGLAKRIVMLSENGPKLPNKIHETTIKVLNLTQLQEVSLKHIGFLSNYVNTTPMLQKNNVSLILLQDISI